MTFPQRLLDGYGVFRDTRLPIEQARFRELADAGQKPETMIIGCCDSRVSPEVIFDAGPGELFVVRNVANLVPPYEPSSEHHGVSSAIEFAVQGLKVGNIVVLGHARCGGIRAFAHPEMPLSSSDFIGKWVQLIGPAAERVGRPAGPDDDDYLVRLEQAAIRQSLANLSAFPFVRNRMEGGQLHLHGAYFDVATGLLDIFDPTAGAFVRAEPEAETAA